MAHLRIVDESASSSRAARVFRAGSTPTEALQQAAFLAASEGIHDAVDDADLVDRLTSLLSEAPRLAPDPTTSARSSRATPAAGADPANPRWLGDYDGIAGTPFPAAFSARQPRFFATWADEMEIAGRPTIGGAFVDLPR